MSTPTPNVPLLPGSLMFALRTLVAAIFVAYCIFGLPEALAGLRALGLIDDQQAFGAGAGLFVLGATACQWLFYRLYRNAERRFDAGLPKDEALVRRRDRFVRRYYWLGGHLLRAHRVRTMSPEEFEIRARRHELEIWIAGTGVAAVLALAFLQIGTGKGFLAGFAVAALVGLAGTIWTWFWPVKAS